MTSNRRILANRANARKSSGPRTLRGKARTRHNALRHGLSTICRDNPVYADEIAVMAKAICAGDERPFVLQQAFIVAECQVVFHYARAEKIAMLERLRDLTASSISRRSAYLAKARARMVEMDIAHEELMRLLPADHPGRMMDPGGNNKRRSALSEPQRFWKPQPERDDAEVILEALPDLLRLARYERRAWSRRNRALARLGLLSDRSAGAEPREIERDVVGMPVADNH